MGLSYNEETAVNRDYLTQYQLDTTFLTDNSVSRDIEAQNTPFILNNSAVGNVSLTLTQDVIITQLSFNVSFVASGGNGVMSSAFYVNGILQDGISITAINLTANSNAKNVPVPNWYFKAGTIFLISNGVVNGASTSWITSIIGYYT